MVAVRVYRSIPRALIGLIRNVDPHAILNHMHHHFDFEDA